MITSYKSLKEYDSVLSTYDKLISLDPNNPAIYLNKAKYEKKYDRRHDLINLAMEKDEYFYGNYYEMASLLSKKYFSEQNNVNFDEIVNLYDEGIKRYPDSDNRCWDGKFDFILRARGDQDTKLPILNKIISSLEEQSRYLYKVFKFKMSLHRYEEREVDESFLNLIREARGKCTERYEAEYDMLMLEALSEHGDKLKIEDFIRKIDSISKYAKNTSVLELKARVIAQKLRDLDRAIEELEKVLKIDSDKDAIKCLIEYKIYKTDYKSAEKLLERYESELTRSEIMNIEVDILEARDDHVGAYTKFKEIIEESLFPDKHNDQVSYYLIQIGEYEEAKRISKKYLDEINFNKYADVAIINYELSQILIDSKKNANKKRLNEAYDATKNNTTRAAIQALLKDKDKAFYHIKTAMGEDYTYKFVFLKWPVFNPLHDDVRWKEIVCV